MRDAKQATEAVSKPRHAARAKKHSEATHQTPAPTDPAGNGGGEAIEGSATKPLTPRQSSPRAENSTHTVSETREGGGGHQADGTQCHIASPDKTPAAIQCVDTEPAPPQDAPGQTPHEIQARAAGGDEIPGAIPDTGAKERPRRGSREGQPAPDTQNGHALPAEETPSAIARPPERAKPVAHSAGEPEAHLTFEDQRLTDLRFTDPLIAELTETWRSRQDMVRAQQKLTLQIKSICRRFTAGDKPEADRLYRSMQNGQEHPMAERCYLACVGLLRARDPVEDQRKAYEKHIARLAKQLPIWPVVEGIRGVGPLALGAIVGECGDLSAYKSVSAVWKRAGLAVIDGGRQRRVSGDAALLHGYSPERRAVFFTISDAMLKAQGKGDAAGPYRRVYDARKAYERPRVESDGHAHNRALRFMCKRLLRDLTAEWRRIARVRDHA